MEWLLSLLIPEFIGPIAIAGAVIGAVAGACMIYRKIFKSGYAQAENKHLKKDAEDRKQNDAELAKANRARHSVDHSSDSMRNDKRNRDNW